MCLYLVRQQVDSCLFCVLTSSTLQARKATWLMEALAAACAGSAAYPVPQADVVHGIAVLEAVVKSAASGKPEKVQ